MSNFKRDFVKDLFQQMERESNGFYSIISSSSDRHAGSTMHRNSRFSLPVLAIHWTHPGGISLASPASTSPGSPPVPLTADRQLLDGGGVAPQALMGSRQLCVLLSLPLSQHADEERHQIEQRNAHHGWCQEGSQMPIRRIHP